MIEHPDEDAPDGTGRSEGERTRPQAWAPALDEGEVDAAPARPAAAERPAGGEVPGGAPPELPRAASTESPPAETPPGERIAKAMARAGVASRREAEAMILAGRVSVNGQVLESPARNVTDDDRILVDGQPMPARERSRLWVFHKPRGLVTTARDPEGRQTVFAVLPEDMPRVVAVGRLDINTEGLLLLTNDGGLAKVIAHPDTGWLRRYRVRAHGDTDQAQLDRLARGVTIDGMEYGPIEATLDRVQGDNLWLTLGLREGKNREVKRILEHLGLAVNRLIRLSFGPFQLGDLEPGLVEEVRTRVLKDQLGKALAAQAGVDFESPVRDPIAPFGRSDRDQAGEARKAGGPPGRADRPARDPARPARPQRVSTGGAGPGPRRSAWRADPAPEGVPRPARVPRRGADPRAARAAAAERGRERVGSIRTGERRVVVERLAAAPAEPTPAEAPRRRYADRGADRAGEHRGGPNRGDRAASSRPPRDPVDRPSRDAADGRARAPRDRDGADRSDARRPAGPGRAQPTRSERPRDERRGTPGGRPDTAAPPRGRGGPRPAQGGGDAAPRGGGFRPGGAPGGRPGAGGGARSGQARGADGSAGADHRGPGKGGSGRGGPNRGGFGKGNFGKGGSDRGGTDRNGGGRAGPGGPRSGGGRPPRGPR